MPETPQSWLDTELAAKWAGIRQARRVVTAALEVQRVEKVIGASLEAAPQVFVQDAEMLEALKSVDFADVCITSSISVSDTPSPESAFQMSDVDGVAVVFAKADGEKCQRCWKILPDVGQSPAFPGTCGRCVDALNSK